MTLGSALVVMVGWHAPLLAQTQQRSVPEPAAEARVQPPRLLAAPAPPYPPGQTQDQNIELRLLVLADGSVGAVELEQNVEPFSSVAMQYAQTLEFFPALVGGVPRDSWITFRVEFQAPEVAESVQAPSSEPDSYGHLYDPVEAASPAVVEVVGDVGSGATRIMADADTQLIPGAEGDPLRALDAYPGTVPILASGPFIGLRGASPGMVSYDYDGISVPFLFHLARGRAVVSPWLVDSASMHGTLGSPSYGSAVGGTIAADAAPPEGRFRAHGRVLASDSELGVEAPFAGGKGNALVAGRYSYTKPLVSLIAPDFTLNYWDYQARVSYRTSAVDSLELLLLGAGDHSGQAQADGTPVDLFKGSFHRAALRFAHRPEASRHYRLSLVYGHDRWDAAPSPVRPWSHSVAARLDVSEPTQRGASWRYGTEATLGFQTDHFFETPGSDEVRRYARTDLACAAWGGATLRLSSKSVVDMGARLDFYFSGQSVLTPSATALAASPRLKWSHRVHRDVRLHHSLGMGAGRPSAALRPPGRVNSVYGGLERSALSDLGVEFTLPLGMSLDTTVFHNAFFHVDDVDQLRRIHGQLPARRGQGQASGAELLLRRAWGARFAGFLAYTLSSSWRSMGRLRAPAQYDRRHVLDITAAYAFDQGWSVTSRATYYSGFPARMSSVSAFRAQPRAKPYFQLDWQVAKRWTFPAGRSLALTMGVLNTTLSSDSNDMYCHAELCEETLVGPATVPTLGLTGEL